MLKRGASVRRNVVGILQTTAELTVRRQLAERDSPKSHFIVISFLVITSTLLVLAVLKQYGLDLQAIFARSGLQGVAAVSDCSCPASPARLANAGRATRVCFGCCCALYSSWMPHDSSTDPGRPPQESLDSLARMINRRRRATPYSSVSG